ncbi:hypothetical protein TELCIR_24073, partial [Teladorsagia circumcincta]
MVHYKSNQFGCHYQACNNGGMPPISAFACVFNNPPAMNEPLYIASTQGQVDGCNDDSNCDQYLPFAKCTTASDPANHLYKGLCYSTNETTFITSSTVATTPEPTTEMTTAESTTMAETTEASSVTTETMSMSTETESMTTEASTMEAETSAMSTEEMSMSTEEMAMTTEEMSMTTETMAMTTETTSTVASTTPFFDPITDEIRTNITNMHNYR